MARDDHCCVNAFGTIPHHSRRYREVYGGHDARRRGILGESRPRIHDAFADLGGKSLTPIDDRGPGPPFFRMRTEVDEFDAESYTPDHRGAEKYVATFPKK